MATASTTLIDWSQVSASDHALILQIARRARRNGATTEQLSIVMDLSCVHIASPLRLQELLDADDFNFNHDVFGICRHLNRETGELEDCFLPRFTA